MSISRPLILLSCCLLAACATTQGGKSAAPPEPTPEPEAAPPTEDELAAARKRAGWSVIQLNGTPTIVRWSDGDSFKFRTGTYKGHGVRLTAYNTLESYGPVHRWGDWTAPELYKIAKSSRMVAAKGDWTCSTDGSKDGYGRVLVSCPEAAEAVVAAGHGHVFSIDDAADPKLLKVQAHAQKGKKGIWAKGVPAMIITSLHSVDEQREGEGEQYGTYDRMVDTRTGMSTKHVHSDVYAVCQEVCLGPDGDQSCMVYVPFEQRYRDKAECLRVGKEAHGDDAAEDSEAE